MPTTTSTTSRSTGSSSSSNGRRKHRKERFENRFNAMKVSKENNDDDNNKDELYNVMVDRLSKELQDGNIDPVVQRRGKGGKSAGRSLEEISHREQAHILIQEATNKLTKRVTFNDDVQIQHFGDDKGNNSDEKRKGNSSNSSRNTNKNSDNKPNVPSHSRQQAADWIKANKGAVECKIQERNNRRSLIRKEKQQQQQDRQKQDDDSASISYSSEEDDDDYADSDSDSDTEQEINTTRALLEEAASRLMAGNSNLEAGVNNIIFSTLLQELGIEEPSTTGTIESPKKPISRSQQRAAAAAATRFPISPGTPTTHASNSTTSTCPAMDESSSTSLSHRRSSNAGMDDSSSRSQNRVRREYAASMLSESKDTQQSAKNNPFPPLVLHNPLAPPSQQQSSPQGAHNIQERRSSAGQILKNLQDKQSILNQSRRSSAPNHLLGSSEHISSSSSPRYSLPPAGNLPGAKQLSATTHSSAPRSRRSNDSACGSTSSSIVSKLSGGSHITSASSKSRHEGDTLRKHKSDASRKKETSSSSSSKRLSSSKNPPKLEEFLKTSK